MHAPISKRGFLSAGGVRRSQSHPITTIPAATKKLGLTALTVRSAVESLEKLGIIREITGKQRDRIYVYDCYVKIFDEGTEPIAQTRSL